MKFPFSFPLSSGWLWEFSFLLVGVYLLFYPSLTYPASVAVALGGGLFLLFFRNITPEITRVLGKSWLLFLAYLLATSIWSVLPGQTFQSAGLVFLGSLLFAMARLNSKEAQGRIEVAGWALALVAAAMGIYQWCFGFEKLSALLPQLTGDDHEILQAAIHNKRAAGPFATQGALAGFLILFIPIGFVQMKIGSGFKKKVYGLLTLVLGLGLLATQSVGAVLCLTLAVLAALLMRRSKAAIGAVLTMGSLGLAGLILARGTQSWLLAAFKTRLILWQTATWLFAQHPWLGTGLGTFAEIYQRAGLPMETGARFTHNVFLQVLVETGIVGLFIFFTALVAALKRLKIPSRWEGWGVGTGVLAFLLFSLLDLPFQMPELVWFFAVVAGRLELRPEPNTRRRREDAKTVREDLFERNQKILFQLAQFFLLVIFLISGFWPPFRPWNFTLVAAALWMLVGLFQQKFDRVPLWIGAGALFLAVRAFFSPSALGAVWFFEMTGILLAFYLVLPCFEKPDRFLKMFFSLGLVWALKAWWVSVHYAAPGLSGWLHFQFSDVKDWMIFPNPKQVGIFLIPLVLILGWKPLNFSKILAVLAGLLTMARLKASSPLAGLGAGFFYRIWVKSRLWAVVFLLAAGGALISYRMMDPSATSGDRLFIWKDSCKVWLESPWIGVGPGAFAGLYHQVKTPRTSGVSRYLMDAQYSHNEFLELLTAFGLVGFIFGIFLLAKVWRDIKDSNLRAGMAGLGAASLVDFCLHTPLIALQGVGLLMKAQSGKIKSSWVGGFLALGLSAGLFVPAIFAERFKNQAELELSQNDFLPSGLRFLETAERLNAWDARFAAGTAEYYEKLYFATKDKTWEGKSDNCFEEVLELEKTGGQNYFEKARRLTKRLALDRTPESVRRTAEAWAAAKEAMPFNALIWFEEGMFYIGAGDKEKALFDFKKTIELEPNYAVAWVNEGLLLKRKGDQDGALADFKRALEVYRQWKDAGRIDPLEKQMVTLPPGVVEFLKTETAP